MDVVLWKRDNPAGNNVNISVTKGVLWKDAISSIRFMVQPAANIFWMTKSKLIREPIEQATSPCALPKPGSASDHRRTPDPLRRADRKQCVLQ